MLAVIAIMMILFGIAMAPFDRLMGGSGVDGAARMIGAQLRLARQYALANRKYVAVVMPSNTGPDKYKYTAFRTCVVDSSGNFVEWVPDTKWESLPQGVIISEVDNDYTNDDTDDLSVTTTDDPNTTIEDVDVDSDGIGDGDSDGVGDSTMRAVMFAPSGKLGDGNQRYVTVLEGVYSGGPVARNQSNIKSMKIDTYTGRVTYVDP